MAIGAKEVFVMMTLFAKDGASKLVPACTYPLTGLACVSRVYTEFATFAVGEEGVTVVATYGIAVDELATRIPVRMRRVGDVSP
jgi:3-oxoadipate CoA-transferase beta subunit